MNTENTTQAENTADTAKQPTQMDIAQMKKFYKTQIDIMKPRTELMELEARYMKAKAEFHHFQGILAGQEVKPEDQPLMDQKLDGNAPKENAAEVNGELGAGA